MTDQPGWWPFPWLNFAPSQLNQPINPGWSFGNIQVSYAGNAEIEKDVVSKVASYGKQLGIVSEAVLALAGDQPHEREKRIERLRVIVAEVEKVKKEHQRDLVESARGAMASLAKADPAAAKRIAADFAKASVTKSA
jgi:hypothetical protein